MEVEIEKAPEFKEVLEQYKVDFSPKCTADEIGPLRKLHNAQLYFVYLLHTEVEESTVISQKCHELAGGMHRLLQLYDKENYNHLKWHDEAVKRRAEQDKVIKALSDVLFNIAEFDSSLHILHSFADHVVNSKLFDFIHWTVRWVAENQINDLKTEVGKALANINHNQDMPNHFNNPTQAVRELKLEEERRFNDELKKKEQSIKGKKSEVFGFMEWIDEELKDTGDKDLAKLAAAKTYQESLDHSDEGEAVFRAVDFSLGLSALLDAVNSMSTKKITFADDATWETLTFEKLKQLYEKIKTLEEVAKTNPDETNVDEDNSNNAGWAGWFVDAGDLDESFTAPTSEKTMPSGIQLAKKDIISLMKASCLIKTNAKKDFLHQKVLAERDQYRKEAEREEPEQPKTKYQKFIGFLTKLLKQLVGPVMTMFDVVEYLKVKLGLIQIISQNEEEKPLLVESDESEAEAGMHVKPGFDASYWNLINPFAEYDKTEKDPHFKDHLLFQNFHEQERGELHPIDKAYSSRTARIVFGYASINHWFKLIFPLYDILFDPKTAAERGEGVGTIPVITNPFLPLAMFAAIWHEKITDTKKQVYADPNSTQLDKFLISMLEVISWGARGPLLGGAIALNALFVAAALIVVATLAIALTLACIGLSLATVMLAAPVVVAGEIYKLFESVWPEKKSQLIMPDSPLNVGKSSEEEVLEMESDLEFENGNFEL